jgi:hypothetical protein
MSGRSEKHREEKCTERITFRTVTLNPILYVKKRVKQSRYRPGVAQRVPGS